MRVTPIVASRFASDGGTMFGLVPKPIWSRRIAPDDQNRIPQNAHALLVELDDGRFGLIDTGCGASERYSEKEQRLHGLGPGWPLLDALSAEGLRPDDISFVVFTHLHWDHAGGAVAPPSFGRELSFPRAHLYIHAQEWHDALSQDPLLYKSYPTETMNVLRQASRVLIEADESEILPGIWMHRTSGHTRGHCAIRIDHPQLELNHPSADVLPRPLKLLLAGDVCPTRHHLRMVFQTSYDTFPLYTRAWKRDWLPRIAREGILLLFDHDPDIVGATIREDEREEFVVVQTISCG
jgi:glyoxylase-like metal-dependent hydrolase (beta-lactamase superfamily II)